LLAVPRIWEKFLFRITIALKDATPFQNRMYRNALAIGNRMTESKLEGQHAPLVACAANHDRLLAGVPQCIRRMLGARSFRIALTGAAPMRRI